MPRRRLPKHIRDALEELEPGFRRAFEEALGDIREQAELQAVIRAIEEGNIDRAIRVLGISAAVFAPLDDAIRAAQLRGGRDLMRRLPRIEDPETGGRAVLSFDGRADRAERWAERASSRLITEIVDDQREMARQVIRQGIEAGQNPRNTALDIVGRMDRSAGERRGGFIGLQSRQADAALRARAELEALDSGYFRRELRDRRFDRTVAKAIREGEPLSRADVERMTQRYRDRMLRHRGETIARTESLNALRAGRQQGAEQLVEEGLIQRDQVKIRWSATMDARTRDIHRDLDGQEVQLGDLFTSPTGARLAYPGDVEHGAFGGDVINCRCLGEVRIDFISGAQ